MTKNLSSQFHLKAKNLFIFNGGQIKKKNILMTLNHYNLNAVVQKPFSLHRNFNYTEKKTKSFHKMFISLHQKPREVKFLYLHSSLLHIHRHQCRCCQSSQHFKKPFFAFFLLFEYLTSLWWNYGTFVNLFFASRSSSSFSSFFSPPIRAPLIFFCKCFYQI